MLISGIKYIKQKEPEYCAPACASMMLSKFEIDLTQEEIAKKVLKINNEGHKITFTNDICSFLTSQNVFPISISNLPDSVAWNFLKEMLESDIPVMVCQRFNLESNSGHFRVVVGHKIIGTGNTEIITYHDPISGSFQTMKKEAFQELWKPNASGNGDIPIPNQMVILLKEQSRSMNEECMFCKNPDILTNQINTEEAYPEYVFFYSTGETSHNGTAYVCKRCKVKVIHFDNQ